MFYEKFEKVKPPLTHYYRCVYIYTLYSLVSKLLIDDVEKDKHILTEDKRVVHVYTVLLFLSLDAYITRYKCDMASEVSVPNIRVSYLIGRGSLSK